MPTQPPLFERAVSGASPSKPKSEPVTMPDVQGQTISAIEQAKTSDEQFFDAENFSITKNPPEQWIVMHVEMWNEDQYRVFLGAAGVKKFSATEPKTRPPGLVVDKMTTEGRSFTYMWDVIQNYSPGLTELDQKLGRLCQYLGNKEWYLVIFDHTNFDIPWEMIELQNNGYIGVSFITTRWHKTIDYDACSAEKCTGKVLAYVLNELGEQAEKEKQLLQNFHSEIFENIKMFRKQLQKKETGYGLIYMACHGTFPDIQDKNPHSEDSHILNKLTIGSLENEQEQIKYGYLSVLHLNLLKQSHSIVFLNACHSGRLSTEDTLYKDGYLRGFAELFLRKGANGFIGTLAQIPNKYAANFAHQLIQASLDSPHIPVAVLLRNIRAEIVKTLSDDATEEEFLKFIYTFIYVYYGNPNTTLHLTVCEESDNEP